MKANPRIVIFSPMPPARNGIADYCDEQVRELAARQRVTVVVENGHPGALRHDIPGVELITLSEYLWRAPLYAADPHLYHVGNNPGHVYMLPVLLQCPGVVVIHDLTLHHLVDCATVSWGDFDAYADVLEVEYGAAGAVIAEQFRRNHYRETAMFYDMPLIRLITASSKAVVVHSEFARLKVLSASPSAHVHVIPHHVSRLVSQTMRRMSPQQARARLGVAPGELLLVSLGFITRAKQIDKILETLAANRGNLPPLRYVLAGAGDEREYDVHADIRRLGLQDIVQVTGYLPEDEFFVYARAADIVLNLRYPSGGETSGTLVRALGLGAPVVVVDLGPFAELPSEVAVKLPWSSLIATDLATALIRLGNDIQVRTSVGLAAREWIATTHAIEKTSAMYEDVLEQSRGRDLDGWNPSSELRFPAVAEISRLHDDAHALGARHFPLWFRERLLPLGKRGERALIACDRGARLQPLVAALGYERVEAILPSALAEQEPGSAAAVILEQVEPSLVKAARRALKQGGALVLSGVPDAGDDLAQWSASHETALVRAGFRVIRRATVAETVTTLPDVADISDQPCWCAAKVPFDRGSRP